MMKHVLALLTFTVLAMVAGAQVAVDRCGTMEVDLRLRQEDPNYVKAREAIEQFTQEYVANHPEGLRTVYTIPVVFHVVWNTTAENLSDAQIQTQLDVLNEDFRKLNADASSARAVFQDDAADCEINFCLALQDPNGASTNGIIHKNTTKTSFSTNDNVKYSSLGGDDIWDRNSYLNIWVCDLSSGLLGYAQFPGGASATDGVVLDYAYTGRGGTATAPYDLGRSGTHEVGHWLNLYHIWGDDGTGCSGSDLVSDTPNQADETYGCPLPTIRISCSNSPDGDMYENYMDYTDDACMVMFTAGQKTRMQAVLATGGSRASLASSVGCVAPGGGSCNTPTGLSATGITSSGATLNWGSVSGATSYNVQYKVSTSGTWTTTTSTTNSKALTGLVANTTYDYQIQAVCGANSSAYSTSSSFTTSAASCTDILESNNTKNTAKDITVGTNYSALIASSTDKDWYKFANTSVSKNIKVSVTSLPADFDVQLYNPSGTKVATSENAGTSDEEIKYNTSTVGTYKIKVYGYNGAYSATDCYDFRVDISSTAWRINPGENAMTKSEVKLYPNPAQTDLLLVLNSEENSEAVFTVYDMMGRVVYTRSQALVAGENTVKFEVSQLNNGMYIMQIVNGEDVARKTFEIGR